MLEVCSGWGGVCLSPVTCGSAGVCPTGSEVEGCLFVSCSAVVHVLSSATVAAVSVAGFSTTLNNTLT